MEYALGSPKGGVGGEDNGEFNTIVQNANGPFTYGGMTDPRAKYTGDRLTEVADKDYDVGEYELAWTPVIEDSFKVKENGVDVYYPVKIMSKDATTGETTIEYSPVTKDDTTGIYTVDKAVAEGARVAYSYDNIIVPQKVALPTLVGRMKGITLSARARRIAVYYSQIAAYQAKTDYGVDFESTIAQQAQAELTYEIDAEAVYLIKKSADALVNDTTSGVKETVWTDSQPDTVSYSMKAEGFARALEAAKMEVYKRTQRLMPNWMLVSPDIMPLLNFVPGFQASSNVVANGPYIAGNVAGMKVIVSPALVEEDDADVEGRCYLGILGNDGKTAVGVYAPYMPLVPTQLLGFADGGMEQGFSTLYDMKILNDLLLQRITVKKGSDVLKVHEVGSESEEI